jgi:hypothetical protein
MDARILDVVISVISFFVLIMLLALLPMVMDAGSAYLTAIIVFILVLSGAGYFVTRPVA